MLIADVAHLLCQDPTSYIAAGVGAGVGLCVLVVLVVLVVMRRRGTSPPKTDTRETIAFENPTVRPEINHNWGTDCCSSAQLDGTSFYWPYTHLSSSLRTTTIVWHCSSLINSVFYTTIFVLASVRNCDSHVVFFWPRRSTTSAKIPVATTRLSVTTSLGLAWTPMASIQTWPMATMVKVATSDVR